MEFVRQDTSSDPCRVGPDADLTGLGVRIGLYMQCVALSFAAVTGYERTLTVHPSAIMTVLVLNLILAMKASVRVFDLVPTVQDFWVAQTQLFLLTTIVPLTMLFGRWNSLGPVKNVLAAITILFTYGQAFWSWTSGFERSDERICGTTESVLGQWKLFSQGGRWAIKVPYAFGSAVTLVAVWTYAIGSPGVLSGLFRVIARRLASSRLSVTAVVLLGLSVPVYIVCIRMVERGKPPNWTTTMVANLLT